MTRKMRSNATVAYNALARLVEGERIAEGKLLHDDSDPA